MKDERRRGEREKEIVNLAFFNPTPIERKPLCPKIVGCFCPNIKKKQVEQDMKEWRRKMAKRESKVIKCTLQERLKTNAGVMLRLRKEEGPVICVVAMPINVVCGDNMFVMHMILSNW